MKTRIFLYANTDDIVRRCRHCGIRDTDIPFLVMRDTKSGRYYKHCICRACHREIASDRRREWYLKNREKSIQAAYEWNIDNREHYNRLRRERAAKARNMSIASYEDWL